MKKILAILLLLSFNAAAQSLTSSQIKVKTGGGVSGDTAGGSAVTFYRNSVAPASPVTGALWCDTTTTPCVFKHYNGSSWVTPITSTALVTQADASSFPANAVDGQVFFSKNNPIYALFVYDAVAGSWFGFGALRSSNSEATLRDVYNGTLIAEPAAAITATRAAGGGSIANGTYSYKCTFINSTGGETTGGTFISNTVTTTGGGTDSVNLTNIPLGGTGTTKRRIYRTKTGTAAYGPWYFVGIVADNTTTTFTDTQADAALVYFIPDVNFSAPVPGGWVVTNTTTAFSGNVGGCGVTGRGTMACFGPSMEYDNNYTTRPSTDPRVEASLDLSAYTAGNYTVQYDIQLLSYAGDSYGYTYGPCYLGMRKSLTDNDIRWYLCWQGANATSIAAHIWSGGRTGSQWTIRTVAGNSASNGTMGGSNAIDGNSPWPVASAWPIHMRIIKRGSNLNAQQSYDGINWTNAIACRDANTSSTVCAIDAVVGSTVSKFVVIPVGLFGAGQNISVWKQNWIEVNNFSFTVN